MSTRRGTERRRFVRISEGADARVVPDPSPTLVGEGRTLNFSLGGVLIDVSERFEPNTRVRVRLDFDDRVDPIEFVARIVRVRSRSDQRHEIAVEFIDGSVTDQRALQELIAGRLRAPTPHLPHPA